MTSFARSSWVAGLALGMGSAFVAIGAEEHASLPQGWSNDLKEAFYFTPQGSHLVPYAWAIALEVPGSRQPFFAPAHMRKFGYLPPPAPSSELNPDGLPIGFTREPAPGSPEGDWLGMNCAACHTGEVVFGDVRIRVDGAPALADFQRFMDGLVAAYNALLSEPGKFDRFAQQVEAAGTARPVPLREEVESYAAGLRQLVASNWTAEPYGFGRLDAFGHILNAVAGGALAEPENYRSPDAPVSYPFLWTTPQQRYVQWNGVVGNPIGRNTGQVLGVFGKMELRASESDRFRTTVLAERLLEIEQWVAVLEAPPWDEGLLGEIDPDLAARGAELYAEHCQACHRDQAYAYDETDHRLLEVTMVGKEEIGTDPTMLESFDGRRVLPGPFTELAANGNADRVRADALLSHVVGGVVRKDFVDRQIPREEQVLYFGGRLTAEGKPFDGWTKGPSYKAGPLAGVWATAPFLHNGSVPTLYDLLSPEDERPTTFWVGSTTFDPIAVGFLSAHDDLTNAERARLFHFDTRRPGNANTGHIYPKNAGLSHDQRLALIEYVKTLRGPGPAAQE